MSDSNNKSEKPKPSPGTTPHAYQPEGVGRWRTCAACGRGANAGIHKSKK